MPSKTMPGPFGPVWENDEGHLSGGSEPAIDWSDPATAPLERVPMQRTSLWVLGTLAAVVAAAALVLYGPRFLELRPLGVTPPLPSKGPAWQPDQAWVDARVRAFLWEPPAASAPALGAPAAKAPPAPAPSGPAPEPEGRPSSSPRPLEVPDAGIPDADLPDGDVPDADFPDADVPNGDAPDGDFPDAEAPADVFDIGF